MAAGALAVWAGPPVMSAIGPKLSQAGSFLGKAASTIGGNLFSAMQKLPPAQQQQVAEAVTPQQIVEMEQSGRIPPALMQVLDRASEQAYQYAAQQAQPMPGLAPTVMAMKQEEEAAGVVPIQAGMSGEGAGVAMAGLAIAALWFASQGKR